MRSLSIGLIFTLRLLAQTDTTTVSEPLATAQTSINQALAADRAKSDLITTLQTTIAALQATIAANQTAADSVRAINSACPDCLGVMAAKVTGKKALTIIPICCASTTVPPTFPDTVTILYIVDPSLGSVTTNAPPATLVTTPKK